MPLALISADWYRATASQPQEIKHPPAYDGIVELWFDDREALLAARQSCEWKASSENEANFIDHKKVAYFVSEEHMILGGAR